MKKHKLELLFTEMMEMCFEANAENPKLFMFQQLSKQLYGIGVDDKKDPDDSDEEIGSSTSADNSDDFSKISGSVPSDSSRDNSPVFTSSVMSTPLKQDLSSTSIKLVYSTDDLAATDAEDNNSADLDDIESSDCVDSNDNDQPKAVVDTSVYKTTSCGDSSSYEDIDMLPVDDKRDVGRKSFHSPYYAYQSTDDEEETD